MDICIPLFKTKCASLLANDLTSTIVNIIKKNQHGIIADEATDASNKTTLTLACRTVDDNLNVKECFAGMHVVSNLKSATL